VTKILWFSAFLFLSLTTFAQLATINIVPGKSFGDVNIGEKRINLNKRGFVRDQARRSESYLRKGNFLLRMENDSVVQIWLDGDSFENLRFEGKKFPSVLDLKTLKTYFKDCGPEIKSSGGTIVYCENKGVELTFSYFSPNPFGFSVINPEKSLKE